MDQNQEEQKRGAFQTRAKGQQPLRWISKDSLKENCNNRHHVSVMVLYQALLHPPQAALMSSSRPLQVSRRWISALQLNKGMETSSPAPSSLTHPHPGHTQTRVEPRFPSGMLTAKASDEGDLNHVLGALTRTVSRKEGVQRRAGERSLQVFGRLFRREAGKPDLLTSEKRTQISGCSGGCQHSTQIRLLGSILAMPRGWVCLLAHLTMAPFSGELAGGGGGGDVL